MQDERVLNPEIIEANDDLSLRPTLLKEYIGQDKIKESLDIYIKASAINSDKYLDNFQREIETYFNEKVGIYFKNININIK